MTKDQFMNLSNEERDWLIYQGLPKSTAPGESPIAGIFNKTNTVTPVQPVLVFPEGFKDVFGKQPVYPYGTPERATQENRLRRWGGLYNLGQLPDSVSKRANASSAGLGYPIGYIFDGTVWVTFEIFGKNNIVWFRDLSQYMDNFDDLVRTANLEARQKGLL